MERLKHLTLLILFKEQMSHLWAAALLFDEASDFIRKEMRHSHQYQRSSSVIDLKAPGLHLGKK